MAVENLTGTISNMSNINGIGSLLIQTNSVINGMLGIIIYTIVCSILFITLKSRGFYTSDAILSVGFFGFVLSMFLRGLNIIPEAFFYANVVVLAAIGIYAVIANSN